MVIRGLRPEAALTPLALHLADTGWALQRRVQAGEATFLGTERTLAATVRRRLAPSAVTAVTSALTATVCMLRGRGASPATWPCGPPPTSPSAYSPQPDPLPACSAAPARWPRRACHEQWPPTPPPHRHHYFPPEPGLLRRLSALEAYASAGDSVTVLTGTANHPTGRTAARAPPRGPAPPTAGTATRSSASDCTLRPPRPWPARPLSGHYSRSSMVSDLNYLMAQGA